MKRSSLKVSLCVTVANSALYIWVVQASVLKVSSTILSKPSMSKLNSKRYKIKMNWVTSSSVKNALMKI